MTKFAVRFLVFFIGLGSALLPLETGAEDKQSSSIRNSIEAPFGLKWGMSVEDAKAQGITLTALDNKSEGKQFTVTNLPKVLADTEFVLLHFGYNNKLWLVAAISKSFDSDPYGGAVQSRYDELNRLLEKKYGKGNASHHQDRRLYTRSDEFLAGIKNGRSIHATSYKKDELSIELSIGANSYSDGYYRLRYENAELAEEYKKAKKEQEGDAL